eukprot:Protomagalhaensia_wolfi_Nauph_80__5703@NODE_677_length_2133_cov_60_964661_g504_i0_p1_GENE_NODE_677_length_2133_cov_60_964661_g504_i0NODE_677_length_2133_cov_60_964661_g504_i0_p1_ORF_typecomplete_len275_score76_50_NODE_677_length_2133_cov_60_964661_g504_i011641988
MTPPEGVPNFVEPDPTADLMFVRNLTSNEISDEAALLLSLSSSASAEGIVILEFRGSFMPEPEENLIFIANGRQNECLLNSRLHGSSEALFITAELAPLHDPAADTTEPAKPEEPSLIGAPTDQTIIEPPSLRRRRRLAPAPLPVAAQLPPSATGGAAAAASDPAVMVEGDNSPEPESESWDFSLRAQDGCRCRKASSDSSGLRLVHQTLQLNCDAFVQQLAVPVDDLPKDSVNLLGMLVSNSETVLPSSRQITVDPLTAVGSQFISGLTLFQF